MANDSSSSTSSSGKGRKRDRAEEEVEECQDQEVQSQNPPCSSASSKKLCSRSDGEDCCHADDEDDGQDLSAILEQAENSFRESQRGRVSDVMKSLEEEINPASSSSSSTADSSIRVSQIGYLLEASDDELGLEPKLEHQPAVVDEEDLVRGWSSDWSGDFSDDGFIDVGASEQQQEWIRRALETFMDGATCSSSSSSPLAGILGQGFEPPMAGLIL